MDPLQLLERLLAHTGPVKAWLEPAARDAWDETYKAFAQLRQEADRPICVGDVVRSYDFTWPVFRTDCYVEGYVEAIGKVEKGGDIDRYTIRCTMRVMSGAVIPPENDRFFPPVNGTPSVFGHVTDCVRRLVPWPPPKPEEK